MSLGTLGHIQFMASLYERTKGKKKKRISPFWWIKYRAANGCITRESTGFKIGVGLDTRNAERLCAQHTLRESTGAVGSDTENWDAWVPRYFNYRYSKSAPSLLRRTIAWKNVRMFLAERKVISPRQVTRDLCVGFMEWRAIPNKSKGKYRASHNTAHYEIKTLSLVMREAVLRNYATFNPCRDLEISRMETKEKPEFSSALLDRIDQAIDLEPERIQEFLRNSFDIARYHGARLSETYLNPLTHVELRTERDSRITFKAKGRKTHTVMLHPKLFHLFKALRAAGRTETYAMPKSHAKEWHNFFNRTGIREEFPGACFHSLRVTVASTLTRKNVTERKIMAYMGHASTTVARAYVRWHPEDLQECSAALSETLTSDKSASPKSLDSPSATPES